MRRTVLPVPATARATTVLVATVLAAGAVTGCSGSSAASDASPSTAAPTVLHLTAKATTGHGVDAEPKGPSVGDQFFERGTLQSSGGSAAGTYQLVTQLVAGTANKGFEHQSISLQLSGGEVLTLADMATRESYVVPVIGGSGDYAGATGTLAARSAPHHTEQLTLTLNH